MTPAITTRERSKRLTRGLYCFSRHLALVAWESLAVVFFMKKLGPGLVSEEHPWATGHRPDETEPLWWDNVVYQSPGHQEKDREIVEKVGKFLTRMVRRSVKTSPEIPHGPRRRMPHAVNYIHGAVHCNGAFLIFEDIPDLVAHITDKRFRRALLNLGREEKREVTLILRKRHVEPEAYAYCVGCIRSYLPWFSNGNGPTKKPVLWGNTSPYPVINLINGAWMKDLSALWCGKDPVRPPIARMFEFEGRPQGRRHITWSDRFQAWWISQDVRARGFKGQLVFTHRRVIEPHRVQEYKEAGSYGRWQGCHEVPHPFTRRQKEENA